MAKFTKKAIMMCLMDQLKKKQFDKITVKDICLDCEINRNTFYYYFANIDEVLKEVFENEKLNIFSEMKDGTSFLDEYSRCARVILENRISIIHIYKSKMNYILKDYLEAIIFEVVKKFVEQSSEKYNIQEKDIIYITKFYSYSIIGSTLNWIEEGLPQYEESLIVKISNTFEATIDDVLKCCLSKNI